MHTNEHGTQATRRHKIISFIKRKKWWFIIGLIALVLIMLFSGNGNGDQSEPVVVQRGSVVAEVSITGEVKPSHSIDLAFEQGGRISAVYASVGKEVYKGATLVVQENASLYAQLSQAQAGLATQQAKLDELTKGARPQEIAAKEAELNKAKQDLSSYYNNAINVLNDAYAKANDAVRKQTDSLFDNDESTSPQLTFSTGDAQAKIDGEFQRVLIRDLLNSWAKNVSTLQLYSLDPIDAALEQGQNNLATIRTFLNVLSRALDSSLGLSSTDLAAYKASINTALSNINTAASSVSTQQQSVATQKLIVERISNELSILVSGATQEQIKAQEAQVLQAQGQVDYYYAQIAKTVLRASFDGVVTKVAIDPGEIVAANIPVVSIIGAGAYEIEAYITESDIAKVRIGNTASVTLDAYGSGVLFNAKVTHIDISETRVEGVATYKALLQFSEEDERILPGLTANIDILTNRKDDVLYIPTREILIKEGKKYVTVREGENDSKEVEIETGLRGSDGRTEIISGLSEGQVLVTE